MLHALSLSWNNKNYSKHVVHTHSSPIISASAGIQYLLLCLYWLHILSMIWMVWMLILCVLCMNRIQWWRGMRGRTTHVLLFARYTAHNLICVCIAHMLLTSISWNFSSDYCILTHVRKCQVKMELYCMFLSILMIRSLQTLFLSKVLHCSACTQGWQ